MEHRIEPLIAERAPWLYSNRLGTGIAKRCLHRLLGYDKTVEIATSLQDAPASEIMDQMAARLSTMVAASGLGHIPTHGPALIVANHPTGIADGIILHGLDRGTAA